MNLDRLLDILLNFRGRNALWVKTKNADLAKKRSIISSFASNNDLL